MRWYGLFWLIVLVMASGTVVDAQRLVSVIDQINVSSVDVAYLHGQLFAADVNRNSPQTRGRWRRTDDRDSDNRDSDRDSDSEGRRNRRWRGFPFPDRDRNESRREPRDRDRDIHNIALENGYSDGYQKGLDDGRRQRGFDPSRHRWYRDADRGYDSRYGSRARYTRVYREGFRDGYDNGYRDSRRSGRGRDDRWSIPWPW